MDVVWLVMLVLENAHLLDVFKAGYFMDREKCFDRLPWEVTFGLETATGYPSKWTQADARFNAGLWASPGALVEGHQFLSTGSRRQCSQSLPSHGSLGA